MARTLNDIQQSILAKKTEVIELNALEVLTTNEKSTLEALTSTSKVAIWRLWVYIVAFAVWSLENLFDVYKLEVEQKIAESEVHNFLWYKKKALEFRYGQSLIEDSDRYSDADLDVSEIEESQIIKQVAVIRKVRSGHGYLEMKLAKEQGGELVPLNEMEMQAFEAYMFRVADAGTLIQYITLPHDDLQMSLDIHYNPQILWQDGSRKDGAENEPVKNAINEFLYNLEFNGELILTKLVDHLQKIEGVEIPVIQEAFSKYGNLAYTLINETYIARAGYMRLDIANTEIKYVAREV